MSSAFGPARTARDTDAVSAPRAPAARLDLVVGITSADAITALECAQALDAALVDRYSARPRAVFRIAPGKAPVQPIDDFDAPPEVATRGGDPVAAVLEAARAVGATALGIVGTRPPAGVRCLGDLLAPVLEQRCDVVAACYPGRRLDGAIQSGIAYPVTRALFGTSLRQPFTRELALSSRAVEHLLSDGAWLDEVSELGSDLWVGSPALTHGMQMGQAWLASRPASAPAALADDASGALGRILGVLFRAMERHVESWQRRDGATPVATFGTADGAGGHDAVDTAAMLEMFRTAARELAQLWARVLSPATAHALQRAAAAPAATFHLPDATWARAIYECALAWHARTLPRSQVVASMTPLYHGWLAGFAREVLAATPDAAEWRVEALCVEFERAKRELVARWRWPDPFVP